MFRIRLSNDDLGRVISLLGGHPSEHQIMRWAQQTLVRELDRYKPVIHSAQTK